MADTAQFTLQLIDKVTGPSRRAASALEDVEKKLKKSKGALASLNSQEAGQLFKAKGLKAVEGGVSKITSKLWDGVKAGVALGGAMGAVAAVVVTKGVVSMATFADATRRAFSFLTGDAGKGADAFDRARKLAELLGADIETTATSMKHLLAMQFSVGEAEELIKISADLQAITGDAESVQRAITAITQIKAKGKLQSEELVGQLAEAGVSTTLVYEELAKNLGKTIPQVRELIGKGEIDAGVGIKAIKGAILKKVHKTKAGEAAVEFSNETLAGIMATIETLPKKLFAKVADMMEADFGKLKGTLKELMKLITEIDAGKIADFVREALEMFTRLVPLAKEFSAGFGEGFSEILAGMRESTGLADNLSTAHAAGKGLAELLGVALKVVAAIGKLLDFFSTPIGKVVAGFTVLGALAVKFLMMLGSVVTLFGGAAEGASVLMVGWGAMATALSAVWSVLLGIGGAIWWAVSGVAAFVAGLITLPVIIGAAAVAAIAWIITFREEIAKVMLAIWDAVTWEAIWKSVTDLFIGIYNGLGNLLTALWGAIVKFAVHVKDLFVNIFTGNWGDISKADFGIGSTESALAAAGLGKKPTAAPMPLSSQPELTPTVAGAMGGAKKFETQMTVNVEGLQSSEDPKEVGRKVGEGAAERMESFFGDMALQSGA